MSAPMWWVIWPVRWLRPTLRSYVTAPIHRGVPPRPYSVDFQNRTWWRWLAFSPDGLLEGEVLLAAEHEQGADRGIDVGPVPQHAAGDADAATSA